MKGFILGAVAALLVSGGADAQSINIGPAGVETPPGLFVALELDPVRLNQPDR
jgi:hypothetical protein